MGRGRDSAFARRHCTLTCGAKGPSARSARGAVCTSGSARLQSTCSGKHVVVSKDLRRPAARGLQVTMYPLESPDQFITEAGRLVYRGGRSSWEVTPERIFCVGEATSESPRGRLVAVPHHGCTRQLGRGVSVLSGAQRRPAVVEPGPRHLAGSEARPCAPFPEPCHVAAALQERALFAYQASLFRRTFSRGLRRLGVPLQSPVQTVHPQVMDSLWRTRRVSRSA